MRSSSRAGQAAILDVASSGPGSLLRRGNRVLVEVRFAQGAAARTDSLRRAGAEIVDVSRRYQTVTVAAFPGLLPGIGKLGGVEGVTEILAPIVSSSGPPPLTSAAASCPEATISEGDGQLRADEARVAFGVDGSGVKVGVLSDSFDLKADAPTDLAADVASGDLPGPANPCGRTTPVQRLDDSYAPDQSDPEPSDEGRAMAQIVHDLAPGAELAFATAFKGITGFAGNIRDLADADTGADVIVDDVSYLEEPFFQEGPIGVAVSDVTDSGVAYFSSAGNNNIRLPAGMDVASWETPGFRGGGGENICPVSGSPLLRDCLDFGPGAGTDGDFEFQVEAGRTVTIDLQWAQPWYGVTTDFDAYLLDASNQVLTTDGGTSDNVGDTQRPVEVFSWENTAGSARTVKLVIDRCTGDCNPDSDAASPRIKFAILTNGGDGIASTEYPESAGDDVVGPTIFGHNGAAEAISTGAIGYNVDPSSSGAAPESFSSRGPVAHCFGPVLGVGPAVALDPPLGLQKPELVATDGGVNTFFPGDGPGPWRFLGTSAAAPHAAAVAALGLSLVQGPSAQSVEGALVGTAIPVGDGSFGLDAVGAGMVDAFAALDRLSAGTPAAPVTLPAPDPGPCSVEPAAPVPEPEPEQPSDPEGSGASSPAKATSSLDVVAPRTAFARRPLRRVVRTPWRFGRVLFRFRSNERGADFLCNFDRRPTRRCGPRFLRWFRVGRHALRVSARDRAGNVDRTPAIFRFVVRRIHRR